MKATSWKAIAASAAMLLGFTNISAQDNGLNPVFRVSVHDLSYNIPEKKTSVGSVLGTIASAAVGQASDKNHQDMLPTVNAAVKSAFGDVRRFATADATADADMQITGEVTQMSTTLQVRTEEVKDDKGKVHKRNINEYDGTVMVALTLTDAATSETSSNTFTARLVLGDMPTSESEALNICIKRLRAKITKYYNTMFPLSANIIERGNEKKDKAKEMYIDLGSYAGVYKGQHFTVYTIGSVAGRETRQKTGRLKVADVMGDDIALCKVSSGGKDIKAAFDAGKHLLVVSEE